MPSGPSDLITTHPTDDVIDWRSQLECEIDAWRQAVAEAARRERAFRIQQYLDALGE